jgi:hypothetical protein
MSVETPRRPTVPVKPMSFVSYPGLFSWYARLPAQLPFVFVSATCPA